MPQSCGLCRPKASGAAPKPDLLPDVLTVPGSCYRIGCERRTDLKKECCRKALHIGSWLMSVGPIQLRDKVLRNISAQAEAGACWLEALPSLLGRLETEWNIQVGRLFPNATEAFVSEAVTADGQPVALKIPIPGLVKADRERSLLQTASGRGYVRLLRHDANNGAMLLERLGPKLASLGLPIEDQIRIICRTLQRAWRSLPPGVRYPTGAEKALEMSSYISKAWPRLGRPCSERVIEVALRFAEGRRHGFNPAESVLAHGDTYALNTLPDPETNQC